MAFDLEIAHRAAAKFATIGARLGKVAWGRGPWSGGSGVSASARSFTYRPN